MAEQGPEFTSDADDHGASEQGHNPLAAAEKRRLEDDARPGATDASGDDHEGTDAGQNAAAEEQDSSDAGLQEDPA